jgi:hypothetical protein
VSNLTLNVTVDPMKLRELTELIERERAEARAAVVAAELKMVRLAVAVEGLLQAAEGVALVGPEHKRRVDAARAALLEARS